MKTNFVLVGIFILIFSAKSFGQETSFGDEKAKDEVKKKTSAIYDNKDKTHFFLTKKSFGVRSVCGTAITAYSKENKINRIVSKTCAPHGRRVIEFYFENEKPIFVYSVFEVFAENADQNGWKNFKGIVSLESRFYFLNGKLKFHSHKGRSGVTAKETGAVEKKNAFQILRFVKSETRK